MGDRYDVEPARLKGQKDIVEYVRDVFRRVESGETSLQIGHTAIEDGDLIVRQGDILVTASTADIVVLQIKHGNIPEIRMFPLGDTDTHRIAFFGADFNSGVGAPDQSIQICVETVGEVQDGGKLLLTRNNAILSHQPASGNESYFWLNAPTSGLQEVVYRGRWPNQYQFDNQMGIYPGVINVGGGFTSWTHSYFTSFATTIAPVVGLVNTGGIVSWMITGMTTSAFTVTWTGTAAKTLNFWNFRVA